MTVSTNFRYVMNVVVLATTFKFFTLATHFNYLVRSESV